MIKLFRNFNGVFVAEGMMILDYKSQDVFVLAEFDEVEEFNFIKLVDKFTVLSMEKIDNTDGLLDRFIADVKHKFGEVISIIDIDDVLIDNNGSIKTLIGVVAAARYEVSYTFCPELGRIIDFNHKRK